MPNEHTCSELFCDNSESNNCMKNWRALTIEYEKAEPNKLHVSVKALDILKLHREALVKSKRKLL